MSAHGTAQRYRQGCRCAPCSTAKKREKDIYNARRKIREAAGLPPGPPGSPKIPLSARPHGDYVTYAKGCRCQPCREANTEYGRRRQARLAGVDPEAVARLRQLAFSLGYDIRKKHKVSI